MIYREKRAWNRLGEWIGPYLVATADFKRKLVVVNTAENDELIPLNEVHVKLYFSPLDISHSFLCDLERGLQNFYSPVEDRHLATEIIEP